MEIQPKTVLKIKFEYFPSSFSNSFTENFTDLKF
jgi:hypothetical protein